MESRTPQPPVSNWLPNLILLASLGLVGVVAFAVAGAANLLSAEIAIAATVTTAAIYVLFPESPHFAISFANLTAVYASIFAFFTDEVFGRIDPEIAGFGFGIPLFLFVCGCWLRRHDVRAVIADPGARDERGLGAALFWLIPITGIGALVIVLSVVADRTINTNFAFLAAMAILGLVVLGVSRDVAMFLVEASLLFDEFFQRMARLVVPAFAFLTFYALLVVVFGSLYAIVAQHSGTTHFRIGGVARALNFPEAIHFSIVTISTVGYGDIVPVSNLARVLASLQVICGVLLLLFGVSELLEYTREHRHPRSPGGKDGSSRPDRSAP